MLTEVANRDDWSRSVKECSNSNGRCSASIEFKILEYTVLIVYSNYSRTNSNSCCYTSENIILCRCSVSRTSITDRNCRDSSSSRNRCRTTCRNQWLISKSFRRTDRNNNSADRKVRRVYIIGNSLTIIDKDRRSVPACSARVKFWFSPGI